MFKLFKNFKLIDWLSVLVAVIFIYAEVWLDLKLPDYMSAITKLVQTPGSKMSDILMNGMYMLICAFLCLLCAFIVGFIIAKLASRFSRNLREKLFNKACELSMAEVKDFSTSSLITRTTNDVTQIEMLLGMGLQMLIRAPLSAAIAIFKILNRNFTWSMYTAIGVVAVITVVAILIIVVVPKFKIVQKLIDDLNGVTRENLSGIRVIRAFNAEKYQEDKFEVVNNKLTNLQKFNQKSFAILSPMMYLVMNLLMLVISFTGSFMINDALMVDRVELFGNMVVFTSYASQVIMSFLMLAFTFMVIPRASVSANRINEVLDKEVTVKEKPKKYDKQETGVIEFKNVSFKYPDAEVNVLSNISFKANKGETVAFIGSTGSGKSTLVNLVARFYDATSGSILIDGVNIKDYAFKDLYKIISYIPQKAVIFEGTITSNVQFGDINQSATDKKVRETIEVAQAKEFVESLDNKYEYHVAQRGSNLSGGQKQRLAIARAIARDPEIYIFDDSFSALDYKTDAVLRSELKKYTKDATCLIVAQRIGTIMNADKIVVLDNGNCVGIGTHEELLKTCPIYEQIALSQISEKELRHAKTK